MCKSKLPAAINKGLLTLSPPIPLRLYTLPCWSNSPVLIFDIRALWCSGRQNVKNQNWWVRPVCCWMLQRVTIWNSWHWRVQQMPIKSLYPLYQIIKEFLTFCYSNIPNH